MARTAKRMTKKQKEKLAGALLVVVLVSLALTIGLLVPSLDLPGWGDLFAPLNAPYSSVEGEMEVHFIDVGNADCTLVRQGDFCVLIDAGERGDRNRILQYLNDAGVRRLDLVIATHAHADHIGSMAAVLESIPTERMLLAYMAPEDTPTSATYIDMLEVLDEKSIPVEEAVPGAVYTVGEAQLQVLAPIEMSSDCNDMSVVTRLTFGKTAFLFAGDAEVAVEKDILNSGYAVQSTVLKVGHHGASTSSSAAFLKRVAPQYAVIPCGSGNSYGHPHTETLERLDGLGATVYRSDVHGDVVFTSDGDTVSIETEE